MRLDRVAKAYLAMRVPQRYPAMETSFGEHSVSKIEEAIYTTDNYSTTEPYFVSPDKAKQLHDSHKVSEATDELTSYTNNSLMINSALHKHYGGQYDPALESSNWGGWASRDELAKDPLNQADALDKHLQKHQAREDFHVYTGLPYSPFRHAVNDSGNHMLHLPAFTSTSTNFKKALFFSEPDLRTKHDPLLHDGQVDSHARHVLKLHVPKGSQVASVKHVSKNPDEEEMLINRGYDIAVNPKPIKAKGETSSPTYVWSATLVKRRPKPIPVPQAPRLVV